MENGKQLIKLPNGWINAKLEDISKQITDGSHNPPKSVKSGIPMLSARNINNGNITFDEVRYITNEEFKYENQRTKIEHGDVLLTIVATIGRTAIVSNNIKSDFTLQRSVAAIKPLINSSFLMYCFQSPLFQKQLTKNAKGTAQKGVYLRTLRSLEIPLAPLKEQARIVSKIEYLFSELDQAENGLKKAKQQLKFYRQVILKNAFTNSTVKRSKLGECVSKIGLRIKPDKKSKYKFIGLDSISPNSLKLHQIHEYSNFSSSGIRFNKGDILYSRMRPNLNKVYIADFDGVCSGEFFVLKCSDSLDADFLKYLLHSTDFVEYATNKAKGDRPRLSYGDFASYEINLISKIKQVRIVEDIDVKFSLIDNLENTINKSIKSIESTRNSILKQAFDGKLVLQEPNDESAIELLKRIKVEKEKYLSKQLEFKKKHSKKTMKMSKLLNIEDILKTSKKPMLAKDVWQNSKHKNDIESFYAELKELGEKVTEIKEGLNSLLILKQ
ncbi:restriction endonuclease subunit S [Tenacibaculum maritimum]|uniref:restriction endonuclease subunit S n=1 Tax=Tenacibaculum maritimum TaxID=107401 RepID=UPI00387748BC